MKSQFWLIYNLDPSAYQALRMESTKSIIPYLGTMNHLAERDVLVFIETCKAFSPFILSCLIPWQLGMASLGSILQDLPSVPTAFTALQIAQATNKVAKLDPKSRIVFFDSEEEEPIHEENAFV
jgi:hypothetical protein